MMNRMHSSLSAPLRFSFSVAAGSAGGTFRYGPRQRTKLAGSFAGMQRVTSARQNACKACATTHISSSTSLCPLLVVHLKFAMLVTTDHSCWLAKASRLCIFLPLLIEGNRQKTNST